MALALCVPAAMIACAGCSPDFKDGFGPRVPLPNVTGRIVRRGIAVVNEKVKLIDPIGAEVASARTDARGLFGFADVAPGSWEVKVRPDSAGDFYTVTAGFSIVAGDTVVVPALEVWSYGCSAMVPDDSAAVAGPTLFEPLSFRWTAPSRSYRWMNARLYDAADNPVWFSSKAQEETAEFNGIGNQGSYSAKMIGPGQYVWRVKVELADSVQATTAPRALRVE